PSTRSTSTPLPRPLARTRRIATTRSPASMNSSGSQRQSSQAALQSSCPPCKSGISPVISRVQDVVIADDNILVECLPGGFACRYEVLESAPHNVHVLVRNKSLHLEECLLLLVDAGL